MQVRVLLTFVVFGFFTVTFLPKQARAKDETKTVQAKKLFDLAETDYRLSRFEEALDNYKKAYELYPAADFLFNIGQCHRNLKQYEKAIFSFEAYVRDSKSQKARLRVEKLIEELKKIQANQVVASERAPEKDEAPDPLILIPVGKEENSEETGIYSTWWFWTSVIIAGAAVGGGIYLGTQTDPMAEPGSLGGTEWR